VAAIHQFIPTFAPWDAIGTHARELRRLVRGLGLESDIYCDVATGSGRGESQHYRAFTGQGSNGPVWLLYQLSTGSVVADFVRRRPEPKLVNYHNVTPAPLFAPWEPHVGVELEDGRRQLAELAPVTELAVADSGYNQAELVEAGYRPTTVAPVLVDLDAFDRDVDAGALDELRRAKKGGGSDWLFVGRVSPNKCHHDLIKALAAYRRLYDPHARLHLVGGSSSHAYWTTLQRFVAALGLTEAVRLTGAVPLSVLSAHFRAADVFVCLSEHEGFCVPLLEAMHHRLPIVAFGAAAVPETLAGAGVALDRKDPVTVAAAVHRVLDDDALRSALVGAGTARLGDFGLERTRARWLEVLEGLGVPG
jgi:glycosyltransferase involved in cell wall biosynthesis